MENERLRKTPDYQIYQRLYYKERVLPTFNTRWEEAVAEAAAQSKPPPHPLAVRQAAVQECWEKETAEVKKAVSQAADDDLEARKAEMSTGLGPPTTPDEFQEYVFSLLCLSGHI